MFKLKLYKHGQQDHLKALKYNLTKINPNLDYGGFESLLSAEWVELGHQWMYIAIGNHSHMYDVWTTSWIFM